MQVSIEIFNRDMNEADYDFAQKYKNKSVTIRAIFDEDRCRFKEDPRTEHCAFPIELLVKVKSKRVARAKAKR